MSDQLDTFTDRREAIALFDHLRGRDPRQPWPLLPILTFIAPGGSGKSTLIEYLRAKKCCLPDGRAAVPYALLDFTQKDAPKTLLPILVALRNDLQQHNDGQGRHLTFPRFDLGAAIALSISADGNLPLLSKDEIQHRLFAGLSFVGPLGEMGNALGNIVPIIPPLLVALKWTAQIPSLQNLLQRLEKGVGWRWYRTHYVDMGLPHTANISEVILRLYNLSLPGKPEKQGREKLLGQLLPAAFVADLRDALESPDGPQTWSKTTNVVLFLDGYETLLSDPTNTGIRLLEALTLTEHRERGETDPLLVVLGSRQHLLERVNRDQDQPSEYLNTIQEEHSIQQYTQKVYERWKRHLPDERSYLELGDLYLPLWLQDFGMADTRNYLLQLDKQRQRPVFTSENLVIAIHRVTYGHPLSLALAAAAFLAAQARHQELNLNVFELARVPRRIVRGHEHEQIRDFLLSLFLSQLGDAERNEFIFCAVPRTLDAAILRTALRLSGDLETQKRWNLYRHLTFIHTTDEKSMILHPIVRTLLLQRLPPSNELESDYYQIHTLLREHFHKRATRGDEWAYIEEAYHALALGDPEPAITLALSTQHRHIALLKQLLEAVAQAPTSLIPPEMEQRASDALVQGRQYHDVKASATALVLYNWLLIATHEDPFKAAQMQSKLGAAYSELPIGDRAANLAQAVACYQESLHFWTIETAPADYATAQHNMGLAYLDLSIGDQRANLTQAIKCFQEALRIWTPEHMPLDYAMAQNSLGVAYTHLRTGDRRENLAQAIACYQEALRFRRLDTTPADYAMTQHNLGNIYSELPIGDRAANLAQAVACYQEALRVWTLEKTPFDYASTQHDLGIAYSELPIGDRAANLTQAIACYQEALRVWIPEVGPFVYAMTQHHLGNIYGALLTGNRAENVARAITCYCEALRFWTLETAPAECRMTSSNLAHLYFAKLEWEAALDAYRTAIDAGERLYHMGQLTKNRATEEIENTALYHYAAFAAARLGKVKEALLILEQGKTRLLAEALRLRVPRPPNVSEEDWNAFERAGTAIRAAQYGNTAMFDKRHNLAQIYAVREQAVRAANLDLNMAIERLRVHAPNFLREIDLIATQALLPDKRTALVSFCITNLGSIGFVVSANRGQELQAVEVTNFTRVELRHLLDDWQETYKQFTSSSAAFDTWQKTITRTLAALGQRLLDPILFTLSPDIERIIFLPSVELFLLPLHAASLFDNDTIRVCDRYQVSYAPSIKVLADISTRAKAVQGTLPELYAVINPSGNPHLIFTSTEGAAIAEIFMRHNVDEGRIGTKQRVIAGMRGKTYVHFACNSTYDWKDPTRSGLDLADGRLTLTDLQEGAVDMSTARLVTLSSSETGITEIVQDSADEYVGLPAGFMLAGVPCVVSSLWDASDLSTALMMERFYRNHLKGEMNFAAALQEAQRWLRELEVGKVAQYVEQQYRQLQKNKMELFPLMRYYRQKVDHNPDWRPFAHPYYWAAFTMNGL